MKEEYIIINKTALEKRIEELNYFKKIGKETNIELVKSCELRIDELNILLSQSTPLIPEIKKSLFDAFTDAPERGTKEYAKYVSDYISNLKLDI